MFAFSTRTPPLAARRRTALAHAAWLLMLPAEPVPYLHALYCFLPFAIHVHLHALACGSSAATCNKEHAACAFALGGNT
jgi:hypothetical protein